MKYGEMIKKARKMLKLNQTALTNNNISTAAVSDIEKNKVNLVPTKALMIYETLIIASIDLNIEIELDFDDILSDNIKYQQLKQAWKIVLELKSDLEGNIQTSEFELEKYRLLAIRNDIGILKYFILREIAEVSSKNKSYFVKVLFNALDYLKWENFKTVYEKFDSTLKLVTSSAYQARRLDELINYYEYEKERLFELGMKIEPRIFFNLSLFYEDMLDYNMASKYLERYLEYKTLLCTEDYYDALLGKARLCTKLKKVEEGIKLYDNILLNLSSMDFKKQQSIALSNILYNIPKLKTKANFDKVESYITQLTDLISDVVVERMFPSKIYLNTAIGYSYINQADACLEYLAKAFSLSKSSSETAAIIKDAYECISQIPLKVIVSHLDFVAIEELNDKEKIKFLSTMLGIQSNAIDSNDEKSIAALKKYLNDLKEE